MFKFLFQSLSTFGYLHGLLVYLQIKIIRKENVKLPGYPHRIFFRPRSSDLSTFREIFFRKEYDIELPQGIKAEIIIDAGANVGFTTLFFSKKFPNARIFSLEPEQENFQYLKKNTSGYAQITPIQSALWHKKGSIEIVDKGYGVRGFVVEENEITESTILISAITLSDLMNEFNISSIDILKMDIEGSEKEVFERGSEKWLPVTKCLIIELHDRMKEGCSKAVFKALDKYNFEFSIKGENLVFINREFL